MIAAASRVGARAGDRAGEARGRDPGAEQRLADIDVAEPGDDPLVEQRRLDRRHLAGERRGQIGAVEAGFERLRPHAGEQRMRRFLAALDVVDQAEAARIVEAHHGAVVEGQHHMVVARVRALSLACR